MREAGRAVGQVLEILKKEIKPGVVGKKLDDIVRREFARRGGTPTFLGYPGYPGRVCVSMNGEVAPAAQARAEQNGFGVVREYVGHGLGREMHEEPQVPNFGRPDQGPLLQKGMVLAIKPMVKAGRWRAK